MRPFAIFFGQQGVNGTPCLFFIPFTSTPSSASKGPQENTVSECAQTELGSDVVSRGCAPCKTPLRLPPPFSLGPFVFGSKTTSRLSFSTGDVIIERISNPETTWSFRLIREDSQVILTEGEPFVLYNLEEHKFERWRSSCNSQGEDHRLTSTSATFPNPVDAEVIDSDVGVRGGGYPHRLVDSRSYNVERPAAAAYNLEVCQCSLLVKRRRQLLSLAAQIISLVFQNSWDAGFQLSDEVRLTLRHFLMLTRRSERSQADVITVLAYLLPACEKKLVSTKVCQQKGSVAFRKPSEQALVILSVFCLLLSRIIVFRIEDSALPSANFLSSEMSSPADVGFRQPFPTLLHVDSIASANTGTSLGSPSDHDRCLHLTPLRSSSPSGGTLLPSAESTTSKAFKWTSSLSPLSLTTPPAHNPHRITTPLNPCSDHFQNFESCWDELSEDFNSSPLIVTTDGDS